MISPVEFPNARRYGETETIMIPVRPGIIAPPKKRTSQRREATGKKLSTKGMSTAEPIPITEKTNT